MEIQLLNGFNLDSQKNKLLNGFRMEPMNGFRMEPMNGFRMNPSSMDGLDYYDEEEEITPEEIELWLQDVMLGDATAINGLKSWAAKRKKRKAAKRVQKSRRVEAKTRKKEAKALTKEGRIGLPSISDRLLDIGKGFVDSQIGNVQDIATSTGQDITTMVRDATGTVDEKGLFKKKTWWQKQSTTTKVSIIGGGVLLIAGGIYLATKPKKKGRKR